MSHINNNMSVAKQCHDLYILAIFFSWFHNDGENFQSVMKLKNYIEVDLISFSFEHRPMKLFWNFGLVTFCQKNSRSLDYRFPIHQLSQP